MTKKMYAFVLATGAATCAAQAGGVEAFRVDASNGASAGSFVVTFDQGEWEGNQWTYSLNESVDIAGIGVVQNATIVIGNLGRAGGQTVSLNFNVAAGALNTVFQVSSGSVGAAYPTALGRASAAVTLTDTTGDGATLAPDGTSIYSAYYNGLGGSLFAGLLNAPVAAGAFSTVTAEAESPNGGGFSGIAGAVTDISADWTFAVSAFDVASGTSVFTVIPAPGSLALLGLAGLAARRRR
jgi:hypothetical protein